FLHTARHADVHLPSKNACRMSRCDWMKKRDAATLNIATGHQSRRNKHEEEWSLSLFLRLVLSSLLFRAGIFLPAIIRTKHYAYESDYSRIAISLRVSLVRS